MEGDNMIILARNVGEKVYLYHDGERLCEIVVTEIERGGRVKLGFTAAQDIKIWREEIDPNRQEEATRATG